MAKSLDPLPNAQKHLHTVDDVCRAFQGLAPIGRIFGLRPMHVYNWRDANRFPPYTYLALKAAIEDRGYTAPDSLWGMASASGDLKTYLKETRAPKRTRRVREKKRVYK